MQNNDLEKYIKNNRDAFDDAYPSLRLWAAIESELGEETAPPVRQRQMQARRPWYQIAATVAILLSLGGIGGAYLNQQSQVTTAQQVLEEVAPEFSEIEQYYNQRIHERYVQLTSHTQDPEIDADLAQMDQAMLELREELAHAPPGREDQIVQQLMESYRLKLLILERILERIEALQDSDVSTNNNSNETSI
jgi:uncharacterized damage-inducible protein DinB